MVPSSISNVDKETAFQCSVAGDDEIILPRLIVMKGVRMKTVILVRKTESVAVLGGIHGHNPNLIKENSDGTLEREIQTLSAMTF
ncbi:hypothetical protein OS493_014969 [Desmophyllum pertusum]|uniref:Uncharacterized protein n=1 Tax=Desmophyllum pertusum TaxID=174260 RepID=A0A9X0A222_9CNID|nr:hypothetical protein OS493_014969 [Desmophyllum pertusum]